MAATIFHSNHAMDYRKVSSNIEAYDAIVVFTLLSLRTRNMMLN